jgi:hypothetical protein
MGWMVTHALAKMCGTSLLAWHARLTGFWQLRKTPPRAFITLVGSDTDDDFFDSMGHDKTS